MAESRRQPEILSRQPIFLHHLANPSDDFSNLRLAHGGAQRAQHGPQPHVVPRAARGATDLGTGRWPAQKLGLRAGTSVRKPTR